MNSSCFMMLRGKKSTYVTESAQEVGGAKIRIQMKPEGTADGSFSASAMVVGGAYAKLQGPFKWRFYAEGQTGKQEWFAVNQIDTRTVGTKRAERYPSKDLGRVAKFTEKKGVAGVTRAAFEVPTQLKVMSQQDGALEVRALISVMGSGKLTRKSVVFRLNPEEQALRQNIFIPKEIVDSFGNRTAQDDALWE